jgi:hypothetical protein
VAERQVVVEEVPVISNEISKPCALSIPMRSSNERRYILQALVGSDVGSPTSRRRERPAARERNVFSGGPPICRPPRM